MNHYGTSAEEIERRKVAFSVDDLRSEIERVKDECVIGSPFASEETRKLVEDMVIYGAIAIHYEAKNASNVLFARKVIDASTIVKIIDQYDGTAQPPNPAYQQIIGSVPIWTGTVNELLFMEFNNFLKDGDEIELEAVKGNLRKIKQEFDAMVERASQ